MHPIDNDTTTPTSMKTTSIRRLIFAGSALTLPVLLSGCLHTQNKAGATRHLWSMQIVGDWHEEGFEFSGVAGDARRAPDDAPVFYGVTRRIGADGRSEATRAVLTARHTGDANEKVSERIRFFNMIEAEHARQIGRLRAPCHLHALDLEPGDWVVRDGVPSSGGTVPADFASCPDRPVRLRETEFVTDDASAFADTTLKLLGTPPAVAIDLVRVAGNIILGAGGVFVGGNGRAPL